MKDLIESKSAAIANAFADVALNSCKRILTFNIDITKLNPDFADKVNITENSDFLDMFTQLISNENDPAIYYFSINKNIDYPIIDKILSDAQSENLMLNFPAKNSHNVNKGLLYVGKVKRCAWGRLIQHLGYHQNKRSHGLQIDIWAKKVQLPLNLTYTVMFFDKKMEDYLELLESAIALEYKPIIGRH